MADKLKYDLIDKLLFAIAGLCYLPAFVKYVMEYPDAESWWPEILMLIGVGFFLAASYRIKKKGKKLAAEQTQPIPLDDKEKKIFIIALKGAIIAFPMIFMAIIAFTLFFHFKPTGEQDAETLRLLRVMPIAIAVTAIFIIIIALFYFKWYLPKLKKDMMLSAIRIYFMARVVIFGLISAVPFIGILLVLLAKAKMTVPPDWIYWYYAGIPVTIIAGMMCWPQKKEVMAMLAKQERKESHNA